MKTSHLVNNQKFLELRVKDKTNREYLAVKLGLSPSAIQNVETNPNHNPTVNLLLKYVKYFNVDIGELLNDVETTNQTKNNENKK